jgi:3-dehydroquinate dehydratase
MIWNILVYVLDFGKKIYRIFHPDWIDIEVIQMYDNTYVTLASDGKYTVYHNYGSTPEQAREMALWNLKQCYENKKAPLK